MCNSWCIDFSRKALHFISEGIKVLEVGSRDVNGSVRQVLAPIAKQYIGVDIVDGVGVDELLDVTNISNRFESELFDVVVNTEMLEHCLDWQIAIYEMLKVLKKGGIFILTTRSPGFELHDYPGDHWRFTQYDLHYIFRDVAELLAIDDDMTLGWPCGVGVIVKKTCDDIRLDSWFAGIKNYNVETAEGPNSGTQTNIKSKVIFNQYSRNHACADILRKICNKESTILCVGNWEGVLLGGFLPITQTTSVDRVMSHLSTIVENNITDNNIILDTDKQSFDYVVSIDTLEHIPLGKRKIFIERLSGLASRGLILSFPACDAGDAIETDKWINDVYYLANGKPYSWLQGHLQGVLPSLSETLEQLKELGWHTEVTQNGHTPWLRSLLGFSICALEHKVLEPVVLELSSYFNQELCGFDNVEPCYRQIIVATKDNMQLFSDNTGNHIDSISEAARRWSYIEKKILGFPSYCTNALKEYGSVYETKPSSITYNNSNSIDKKIIEHEQGVNAFQKPAYSNVMNKLQKLFKLF